jgi:hypothetical protein
MASPSVRHERRRKPSTAATDEREAAGPVVAVAGEQADAGGVAAGHEAVAVVLDLVQPAGACGRALGWSRSIGTPGRNQS